MKPILNLTLAFFLSAACTTTARAVVVAQHDFEDDSGATVGLSGRGIGFFGPGDAVSADFPLGNGGAAVPGRWLPNLYDVTRQGTLGVGGDVVANWFENGVVRTGCDGGIPPNCGLDVDPDTDWQAYVVDSGGTTNLVNGDGSATNGWQNTTKVAFFQDNHQGDAVTDGRTDRDNYNRDAFLQFTDAAGNPTPAQAGDIIRGSFDYHQVSSVPAFVFTSDIEAMRQDNLDEANHPPLTNWAGGVDGSELMSGIFFNDPKDYHVAVIASAAGFGASGPGQTWGDDGSGGNTRVDWASTEFGTAQAITPGGNDCGTCFKGYFTLEFEFEVGGSTFDVLRLTGRNGTVDPADDLTINLVQADGELNPGGPLPLAQPGATLVEGLVFTDSYKKQAQYWFDNICIVVNGALDECDGVTSLLGDANNDQQVTGADLISVQQNFGKDYTNGTCDGLGLGDANDDCLVTGSDLIAVQQNFGKTAGAAIPEPTGFVAALLLLVAARWRGRP